MITIKYCGPYADHSGYGEANRNAIMAFRSAGVDVVAQKVAFTTKKYEEDYRIKIIEALLMNPAPYDIKIIHVTPDLYPKYMEKGKYNIGHLFWETDKLPTGWTPACNKMHEIWTGCKSNAQAIKKSGVKTPVRIYPQAVDVNLERAKPFQVEGMPEDAVVFYSIFEWIERKNPKALLDCFWKEFKDDKRAFLLLKTYVGDYEPAGIRRIIDDITSWKSSLGFHPKCVVGLCTRLLTRDEVIKLHSTGLCFVSTHRGEGWGLPQSEALILGNNVISTKLGGVHEYLSAAQYDAVPYKLIPVGKTHRKYYEPGMRWADVDTGAFRNKMRIFYDAVTDTTKTERFALIKATRGKNFLKKNLAYEDVGKIMRERLNEINSLIELAGVPGRK